MYDALVINEEEQESSSSSSKSRGNVGSSSQVQGFLNITKMFVGAASFEISYAVIQAGLLAGIIGIILLACMSYFTFILLVKVGHMVEKNTKDTLKIRDPTYIQLGQVAFGRIGYFTVWFGIIAMTLGVVGSYMVFVAVELSHLLSVSGFWLFQNPLRMIIPLIPVVAAMSLVRTHRFLSPFSLFGLLALLFGLIVTVIQGGGVTPKAGFPTCPENNTTLVWSVGKAHTCLIKLHTIPLFLGGAAFLYLTHSTATNSEQAFRDKRAYPRVLAISMVVVTVMNIAFAFFTLFVYGDGTMGNIIDNLPDTVLTTVTKVALCIDLLCTSVLFLYPVTESLDMEIFARLKYHGSDRQAEESLLSSPKDPVGYSTKEIWIQNGYRFLLVVLIGLVAVAVPSFSSLTGLSGGFGNNLLGFILPPILYVKMRGFSYFVHRNDHGGLMYKRLFTLAGCVFVCLFGLVMLVLSTAEFLVIIIGQ